MDNPPAACEVVHCTDCGLLAFRDNTTREWREAERNFQGRVVMGYDKTRWDDSGNWIEIYDREPVCLVGAAVLRRPCLDRARFGGVTELEFDQKMNALNEAYNDNLGRHLAWFDALKARGISL